MTDTAAADERASQLRSAFDALAPTYDRMRFLQLVGARLAELAQVPVGARVLDVGTGTGVVALAAAQRTGPAGSVVALDLSPGMLAHARRKLADAGIAHAEFVEADTQRLDFPDASFDLVLCSSVLPFVPDMLAAVREWRRVLKPGGRVGLSSFGPRVMQPLRDLWEARLRRYGLTPAPLPTHRLPDPAACEALLREAGFARAKAWEEQLGYFVPGARERWADILAGLEGKPLLQLDPAQREQIEAEHLAEISALETEEGLWIDIPATFAFAAGTTASA